MTSTEYAPKSCRDPDPPHDGFGVEARTGLAKVVAAGAILMLLPGLLLTTATAIHQISALGSTCVGYRRATLEPASLSGGGILGFVAVYLLSALTSFVLIRKTTDASSTAFACVLSGFSCLVAVAFALAAALESVCVPSSW